MVLLIFVLIGGEGRLLQLWWCLVFKIVFESPDMPLLVFCLLVFASGVACMSVGTVGIVRL